MSLLKWAMIKQLWRLLRAEVALHKHNKVNRQGVVSADAQQYHIIENVLPQHVYHGLLDAVSGLHAQAIRENSHWRKGMAMGGHEFNSSKAKPKRKKTLWPKPKPSFRKLSAFGAMQ